jgi:hypothetical protein
MRKTIPPHPNPLPGRGEGDKKVPAMEYEVIGKEKTLEKRGESEENISCSKGVIIFLPVESHSR